MNHGGISNTPEDNPLAEVEALLSTAGDYVEPSTDLRPRLLESVRVEQRQQRTRTRLAVAAAVALVTTVAAGVQGSRIGQAISEASAREQVAQTIDSEAATNHARADSPIWGLVEAFWRVRERQANAFGGDGADEPILTDPDSDEFSAQNADHGDSD